MAADDLKLDFWIFRMTGAAIAIFAFLALCYGVIYSLHSDGLTPSPAALPPPVPINPAVGPSPSSPSPDETTRFTSLPSPCMPPDQRCHQCWLPAGWPHLHVGETVGALATSLLERSYLSPTPTSLPKLQTIIPDDKLNHNTLTVPTKPDLSSGDPPRRQQGSTRSHVGSSLQ
jgi:hypothetical protein